MTTNDLQLAASRLEKRDPVLGRIIRRVGPCTLKRSSSYFLTLGEAIVWQQLSWQAARAIHRRLLATLGTPRPRPADFLAAEPSRLARAGLSRQKTRYLRGLAAHFEAKRFPRRTIARLSDAEVIDTLIEIEGIGRWSAEMFLIFGLNRPDVFPFGDLGLMKALGRHYRRSARATRAEGERITEAWRPFRTVGAWYLWASIDGVPFEPSARPAR